MPDQLVHDVNVCLIHLHAGAEVCIILGKRTVVPLAGARNGSTAEIAQPFAERERLYSVAQCIFVL